VTQDRYAYSLENIISCAKYELHWLHLQLVHVLQSQYSQWQRKGDSSVFIVVSHNEISNDSAQIVPRRIARHTTFQTPQLNMTPPV